ncbi:SDR family NAD(P)-dependent oxidoreductase [Henriciella litoralis]|uniref:SDR family NAD(P)-dependent oxidoreductase n=1 Tax=Henriciella litoralis TaxID=568102 RepID=UPI00146E9F58|nr:SDR family NAD(P)-dependent oxidoreductase [Henriciella litoralis]
MKITGSTVLITGANRGLGKTLVEAALSAGAKKVYAAARDETSLTLNNSHVVPVEIDLTAPPTVSAAASQCSDANILINNAAFLANKSSLRADDLSEARLEMETNYWGLLGLVRACAANLGRKPESAIVNILSIGALAPVPFASSYCATKAAVWSLTQSLRLELQQQNTKVFAAFPGPISTEMAREHEQDGRTAPEVISHAIMDAIEQDTLDIFPDPSSQQVASSFRSNPLRLYEQFRDLVE